MVRRAIFILVIAAPVFGADLVKNCTNFGWFDRSKIDFVCPAVGSARTAGEAAENQAKNNFCATGQPREITFKDFIDLQHAATTRIGPARRSEPVAKRDELVKLGEGSLVVLRGWVLTAHQEGAESANCGISVPNAPDFHDIHIAVVEQPPASPMAQVRTPDSSALECSAVVVEMSPHFRPQAWNAAMVNRVAQERLPIRVTGPLFYDSVHSPCTNGMPAASSPRRATVWEIHPIYKFEVCLAGTCQGDSGWVDLDKYARK